MKVKNYGELSELIIDAVRDHVEDIKEIVYVDNMYPANTVLDTSKERMYHKTIMGLMAEHKVTNGTRQHQEDYLCGISTSLEDVTVDFNDGKLTVRTYRIAT